MTSRSFRRFFPQLNIQSIPEDEFYQQASLSQLLTGPDEQELASFKPDVKDPLELVEATPELAGMLGSSLEFVDSRWDSLEASPPPTPPSSPKPPQCIIAPFPLQQQNTEPGPKVRTTKSNSELKYSVPAARLDFSKWGPQKQEDKIVRITSLAKPGNTVNASPLEPQGQQIQNPAMNGTTHSDRKGDLKNWEQQPQGNTKSNSESGRTIWEPQRLQCKSLGNSKTEAVNDEFKPTQLQNMNTGSSNPINLKGEANANIWKNQGGTEVKVLDSPNTPALVETRLQSKTFETSSPVKLDIWDHQRIKRTSGSVAASKRDTKPCEDNNQTCKAIKMDAAWQRNLTNVRVHIRDLGLKVASIRQDLKKESVKAVGKCQKTKTRS